MHGCKGEKVSFSPASPLTLVAAATHLPSLWPIGCPKLNSAQPHPAACCSLAPCGACPPLAGSAFPALFGLNYFFWTLVSLFLDRHLVWKIFLSRVPSVRLPLRSFGCAPQGLLSQFLWGWFYYLHASNLSGKKFQEPGHLPSWTPAWLVIRGVLQLKARGQFCLLSHSWPSSLIVFVPPQCDTGNQG